MSAPSSRNVVERLFYAVSVGVSGAVVTVLVAWLLDVALLPVFGTSEATIAVLSAIFAVPAFWYFSNDVTVPRRTTNVLFACLLGLTTGTLVVILSVVFGRFPSSWGFTGWLVALVAVATVVTLPTYVLVERGVLE